MSDTLTGVDGKPLSSRGERTRRRLLEAARAWARSLGATHLELDSGEARVDAHRFYEREGATSRTVCFGWDL